MEEHTEKALAALKLWLCHPDSPHLFHLMIQMCEDWQEAGHPGAERFFDEYHEEYLTWYHDDQTPEHPQR